MRALHLVRDGLPDVVKASPQHHHAPGLLLAIAQCIHQAAPKTGGQIQIPKHPNSGGSIQEVTHQRIGSRQTSTLTPQTEINPGHHASHTDALDWTDPTVTKGSDTQPQQSG